ncbi:MAG: PA2779 family protein, partial [Nitrospinaceae bacterium]
MKTICRILILAMLHLCWLTSYGYAEIVSTDSAVQSQVQYDRQRILDLLNRQEVVDELEAYGINKVEAVARINSLTDEEVTEIAGKLDELPAGANIGQAVAGAVYLALVITYYSPAIFSGAIYVAFTPIAAGTCIFLEDPWKDCMGDYWGHYVKGVKGIYGDQPEDQPQKVPFEEDCDPGMES